MNEDIEPLDDIDRGNPLAAILEDETPVNEYREVASRALDFFMNCARIIKEYKGDRGFAFDCWLLAMGWYPILGVPDQTALAAKWRCKKANVSKLVKKIQGEGFLNLPPAPGQRSLAGCQTMKQSRKEQLK